VPVSIYETAIMLAVGLPWAFSMAVAANDKSSTGREGRFNRFISDMVLKPLKLVERLLPAMT
jgi:hypothetical protein